MFEEKNVILNTPTGSGKSLVAMALHFASLARGRRSVYTCPIKALPHPPCGTLSHPMGEGRGEGAARFGPDNVGLSTGDATVNRLPAALRPAQAGDAPILCCTANCLTLPRRCALRAGDCMSLPGDRQPRPFG